MGCLNLAICIRLPCRMAGSRSRGCQCPNIELENKEILLVGYGSGDAADAIPMKSSTGMA